MHKIILITLSTWWLGVAFAAAVAAPGQPLIITSPGEEFQDEARHGAMIIGMDRTPKGRIWGCWTGTGDRAGYFILATSDDNGDTWSQPRLVVGARMSMEQKTHGALVGNLWTDPLGRLWLFFDQKFDVKEYGNWFIRCDNPDDAEPVWSEPVRFANGSTLNKPTVLKNGDWLLPVSDWRRKTARVYVSTDEGASWTERGHVVFPNWQFDEHMMVELRDGRIWMLARTTGNPHESFSADHGRTWSEPKEAATVKHTSARFFLRRLASGSILLVKHGKPDERIGRSHLSAYVSKDDGKTWSGGLLLDERHVVSYPDGFQAPDGMISILYDRDRHSAAEILMSRFREEDIMAGKIVSSDAKLQMLVNKATGTPPERLYNGITLMSLDQAVPWPPRFMDPKSSEPMPVPYLGGHPTSGGRPRVIPIDVGRQLFVDDFLIERTDMKRTFHQAEKYEGNPVFVPETEEEITRGNCVYLGQGGVFFDPDEQLFKMFYAAGWRGPLAMATSSDLIHWARPDLSERGNVVIDRNVDDNAVWLDFREGHANERVKYMECHRGSHPHSGSQFLYTAGDGLQWSEGISAGRWRGDYSSLFYNPFRKKWVFSMRAGDAMGRATYYCESGEFLEADWDRDAVYWQGADRLDEPEPEGSYHPAAHAHGVQLYSRPAVAYESIMIGMHQIHRGPDNDICEEFKIPKLTDLELGFSRDGFHWDRPSRTAFIAGTRRDGDWDRAYLHSTTGVFVILDDRLVFPYTGFSGLGADGSRGMYHGASVGLATLRRDGFASMHAGSEPGTLTTRPVTFSGKRLFVNVDAPEGRLRAEVLDADGKPIEPFTMAKSIPFSGDSTLEELKWEGGTDLSALAGQPVRFRFELTNGSLYAFWVSKDDTGRSDGYLAAGGPGYTGVIDTVGRAALEKSTDQAD